MKPSLKYKVYRYDECMAATKYAEDAAHLVVGCGESYMIRIGSKVVWSNKDDGGADESYDLIAKVIHAREGVLL